MWHQRRRPCARRDGRQGKDGPRHTRGEQRSHTYAAAGRHRAVRHQRRRQQVRCDGKKSKDGQRIARDEQRSHAKQPLTATEQCGIGDGGSKPTTMAGGAGTAGATHEASSAATPKQPLAATEQCGIGDGGSKPIAMAGKEGTAGATQGEQRSHARAAAGRNRALRHRRRRPHARRNGKQGNNGRRHA